MKYLQKLHQGKNIGILSEAGCPGIADPGHLAAKYAHQNGISVVPLIGPSSILLALIASGLNGQNFTFHGYLPNKIPLLGKKLRSIEAEIMKQNKTQIFMEAPYRNAFILEHCMKNISPNIQLCIACDINSDNESIQTKSIKKWKGTDWTTYHKRPAIFLIGK